MKNARPAESAGSMAIAPLGYVRHWLVAGPHESLYDGRPADENTLRVSALDHRAVTPPASAAHLAPGPFGEPWRFQDPGENFFVEHTAFHRRLVILDSYAFTELESARETVCAARFWVAGLADLWLNGAHVTRFAATRYMYPDFESVTLPLRSGTNRLCVRLQCVGIRDTRILFGLQLMDAAGVSVRPPGCAPLVDAANWLGGIRTGGRDAVVSKDPAPAHVSVSVSGSPALLWPAGSSHLVLDKLRPSQLSVEVSSGSQTLRRSLEIPANRSRAAKGVPVDLRRARLEFIAGPDGGGAKELPVRGGERRLLARRLLGRKSERDAGDFASGVASVDRREDCADFVLATLLRLESLGLTTTAESAEIRRAALAFRYWSDEPGNDAMCFWSENHSLLFHGCQLIAGRLYPADIFLNSNRTGAVQAALGAVRCREWLDRIEPCGFEEFNSGTYLPITVGALLNVVDFCGDAEMSRRASRLIDGIYKDLAAHAFGGVVVSPQGRVYRNVLYPEESGTQALLSDAASKAPPDFLRLVDLARAEPTSGDWIVYPASSPGYRLPAELDALIQSPVSKIYNQGGAEIVLHKTPAYLLTSLVVAPAPAAGPAPHFQPGKAGYQQHLWQATLGPGCHVFVNHPGSSFDLSLSRPGYWFGNGVMPRLRQREGVLQAIFDIPDGSRPAADRKSPEYAWPPGSGINPFGLHPIPFTHAHWPSDAFDRQEIRDHWLVGQQNSGGIALWCSEELTPHDEVLTGREFRAWAYRSAWVLVCGSIPEHGGFESFLGFCLAREPQFDRHSLSLEMPGQEMLYYGRD